MPKASAADDKKLTSALKRLSVNAIPGIEEVMIVKDDGSAVVFQNPKGSYNAHGRGVEGNLSSP